MFWRLRRHLVLTVVGLALVAAIGTVAWAAIPGPDNMITACYLKSGGPLRVIDPAVTKCRTTETMLQWSKGTAPTQVPGALTQTEIFQTSDTDDPLHLTTPGQMVTISSIHKPAGGWWDNATITASINMGNATDTNQGRIVVNCMIPGGGALVQPLDRMQFGTWDFTVSYSNNDPDIVLKCGLAGPSQPSQGPYDIFVGWATLSVTPASYVHTNSYPG